MRKIVLAALAATVLVPTAAQAQWIDGRERAELARDRADIYREGRDLNYAYRYGSPRDIREAREDYRDAKREYHDDYLDARRDYRPGYRPYYGGYGYYLPRPAYGHHWHYRRDRVLLIDHRGRVIRVVPRYWR